MLLVTEISGNIKLDRQFSLFSAKIAIERQSDELCMEERLARSASTLNDSRKDSNDSPEGMLVSMVVASISRAGPGNGGGVVSVEDGVVSGMVLVWRGKISGSEDAVFVSGVVAE
ncbi:hypothetical protein NPIL_9951 [Nephila pilipes]|uniref:Uncharacterized protein n=1 Tax=Nephila pilipes TaxID=299642 RepID=A0A8X6QJU2_NEPPI|nr:hypothetical protein NPIL_9951 [Nephila pilipes]